jgi:arginase
VSDFRLIVVPYEVGALRMGVGRGPEHLLDAGAEGTLAGRGAGVTVETVELRDHDRDRSGASEAGAGFELIGLVASRVRSAIDDGAFPVLLSGSCFAGLGMVAGIGEESPGVVWFDAHGDFNTPESTVDGYFDGMPVAILTGSAWPNLVEGVGATTVPESAVVLAGARDFDPLERARVDSSALRFLPPPRIDSDDSVAHAAAELEPPPTGIYLHFDLDVLDAGEARVNIYSVDGGLTAAQLQAQVRSILDAHPVRGLSLTAYDPEVDDGDRVPPIAIRLLETLAERRAREQ